MHPYLKYFNQFPELGVPNYDDPDVILCKTRLYTGTFQDSDYRGFTDYIHLPNTKTTKQIGQNPEKYLCAMGFYNFPQFIDMKIKSGTYIHSASEPWSEEQLFSVDRRNNWLASFWTKNLNRFTVLDMQLEQICFILLRKLMQMYYTQYILVLQRSMMELLTILYIQNMQNVTNYNLRLRIYSSNTIITFLPRMIFF